jgi:hypothetical protein
MSALGHDLYARVLADAILGDANPSPSGEQKVIPIGAEDSGQSRSRRD